MTQESLDIIRLVEAIIPFEPSHEKINNLGVRSGLIQIGLYSLRSRLEAFGIK